MTLIELGTDIITGTLGGRSTPKMQSHTYTINGQIMTAERRYPIPANSARKFSRPSATDRCFAPPPSDGTKPRDDPDLEQAFDDVAAHTFAAGAEAASSQDAGGDRPSGDVRGCPGMSPKGVAKWIRDFGLILERIRICFDRPRIKLTLMLD